MRGVYNKHMKNRIELMGRQLEYELQRKNVKNINLRIKPEGLFVSANRLVPRHVIEAFLKDRAEFILAAIDRLSEREVRDYKDGALFPLMGKNYTLRILPASKNSYSISEESITLQLNDFRDVRKSLDKLLKEQAEKTVPGLCEALCNKMGREMPDIKYRAMKSRWGSCTPKKNLICINTRLMTAPMECIEFVIAHELCHFIRADHSRYFYEELEKIMPAWKERKKQLRDYGSFLQ